MANALGQALFSANLDYQYSFGGVLTWLLMILVISALSSTLPARNATVISVRESLAYE
jgi:ABC-type lipoprotein release transport system permease subunit